MRPPRGELRSALYEGEVLHRRSSPPHAFRYPVAMPLLFLDELPALDRLSALAAFDPDRRHRVPTPLRLRRSDVLPGPERTLPEAVQAAFGPGESFPGPVALLAQVRTWGWLFNPLTVTFSFDATTTHVERTVLEVTNTPWHERHRYVVGAPGTHRFPKRMHVSPFLPSAGTYTLDYDPPGAALHLRLAFRAEETGPADAPDLEATLLLRRRTLDRAALHRLLWAYPAQTLRVSAGIYHQAWRLRRSGTPVHPHPAKRGEPVGATQR